MDPNILSVDFAEVGPVRAAPFLACPQPPGILRTAQGQKKAVTRTVHRSMLCQVIVDPSLTERNALLGLFVAVQQISCVRDRSGEIKEGAEDDIKLNKYFLVFQREYVAEEGELKWKVGQEPFASPSPIHTPTKRLWYVDARRLMRIPL